MRRVMLCGIVSLLWASVAWAATYRVTVSRVSQDVYRDQTSQALILTSLCHVYVYGQPATLVWNGRYATGNRLHMAGQSCAVEDVR